MGWTLVVRPKTAADDTVLIRPCWALFIDADEFEVTVAVPAQADREVTDVDGFLVQLLLTVADPIED